ERSSLRRFAAKVAESERWFGERGTPILIFSRLIPGARLPTYLAAGFLRVPLPRFLLITGVAACVWTVAILFLAQTFGERLTNWLGTYKHAGALLFRRHRCHGEPRHLQARGGAPARGGRGFVCHATTA